MGACPSGPFTPSGTQGPRSLIDLRSQIELHETVLAPFKVILDQQGSVRPEPQLYSAAQGSGLREIDEIPQGESRSHRVVYSQAYSLLGLLCLSRLQHHIAASRVSLDAEGDPFLAGLDLHRFTELLQISADFLEFCRRQLGSDLVMLLRDLHVLTLDL